MKGYGLLLLLLALVLLLIPMPALSGYTAENTTTAPTATAATTTAATEDTEDTEQAAFRMLCGDEVVSLPDREFLIRTLAMEMPASYHTEALKAQAVAAYTYYHRRRLVQEENPDPDLKGADFVTPNEAFPQNYTEEKLRERWGEDYDTYYQKIADAVDAVWGETVTYNGELIDACFHAVSNGQTESAEEVWGAEVPYLQTVASPGDRTATGYQSTGTFTADQVREILAGVEPAITLSEDPEEWFGKATLSEAGTVHSQAVGDTSLPGTQIRKLFGLRSAAYAVTYADGTFTFTVCGYGHGVGMSQHGADYLAKQGYTYKEILEYYYTGAKVK